MPALLLLALVIGGIVVASRARAEPTPGGPPGLPPTPPEEALPADLLFQIKQTSVAAAETGAYAILGQLAEMVRQRGFFDTANMIMNFGIAMQQAPDFSIIALGQAVTARDVAAINATASNFDQLNMEALADFARLVATYVAEINAGNVPFQPAPPPASSGWGFPPWAMR